MTLDDNRSWFMCMTALLLLAVIVAITSLDRYPLKSHEILVAQTAQEMYGRGDWTLPYFNGKPQRSEGYLSFWLTGFVAWLDGSPGRVKPWHARIPSALAGIGSVGLTLLLGQLLFNRPIALLSGLILVSTAGYLNYAHNARPEMIYSFWCLAALSAFVVAWQAETGGWRQFAASHLMWVSFAMAVLSRGPQLPMMFLLAFLAFLAFERVGWRRAWRIVRPLSGGALCVALALPWWWLAWVYPGGEIPLDGEITDALATGELRQLLDPYYFYRPLQLILPWLLLVPGAFLLPFLKGEHARNARLLATVIVIVALLLSFRVERRWYFMLPTLAPMCLLMAAALEQAFRHSPLRRLVQHWTQWLLPVHWFMATVTLAVLMLWARESGHEEVQPYVFAALLIVIAFGILIQLSRALRTGPIAQVTGSVLLFLCTIGFIAEGGKDLIAARVYGQIRLARSVQIEAPSSSPLATWNTSHSAYVYFADREVLPLRSIGELRSVLRRSQTEDLWLILHTRDLKALPVDLRVEIIDQVKSAKARDALSLVRVTAGTSNRPLQGQTLDRAG
jgi:4-amino-4-deoxy-L-arabinose transferase-like glycosyltransferase